MKVFCSKDASIINKLNNKRGSSMPVVLMVMLVVMIVGGAVAYATVQLFSIVRKEEHNQMTYIAAESAIERCISNLDQYLPQEGFATDRGILFSSEEQFINDIVSKLNEGDSEIITNYIIPVYADASMNEASVKISFSWYGKEHNKYERIGNKLKFSLEIASTAEMENGMFKSYGRKAVAVKEYEVWIYKPFILNGAVYTLGDLAAIGNGVSTIRGDVYVFGTGLDKPNRMEQYYMGGICAMENAVLHIQEGSAYTRNLLRVGTFDEEESGEKCAIVVDKDVVAEGIQAFGYDDSIVVIRDAYTFDDIEMNGANSYIAINGDYYGLNNGDGFFHDTSSAVLNTAPRYGGNEYAKSRIVINGSTFVNGSAFVMEVDENRLGHQLENVALAWRNNRPVYLTRHYNDTQVYMNDLKENGGNGFSVLIGVDWEHDNDLAGNWEKWKDWISEIRSKATGFSNAITSFPDKIEGLCFNAMAANNKVYIAGESDFIIPESLECEIGNDVEGLSPNLLQKYKKESWNESTDRDLGIPKGLETMMSFLESHVQVFARKDYPARQTEEIRNESGEITGERIPDISYKYNLGMLNPGNLDSTTEFLRIRDELDKIDPGLWECVIKFRNDDVEDSDSLNLADYFKEKDLDFNKYYLIINLDPDRELIFDNIEDEEGGDGEEDIKLNGIIFTMGKVTIKGNATVNGAVIAAGRGYDPAGKVAGSAADFDDSGVPRLPRIVERTNIENFKNLDYAALILDKGNVYFPGRDALLDSFREENDGVEFSQILKGIF